MLAIAKHTHSHFLKTSANDCRDAARRRRVLAAVVRSKRGGSSLVRHTGVRRERQGAERHGAPGEGIRTRPGRPDRADRRRRPPRRQGRDHRGPGGRRRYSKPPTGTAPRETTDLPAVTQPAPSAHYTAAWKDAFKALTQRVTKAVTSIPSSAIDAAATNALGSKQIGLAGAAILSNQAASDGLNGKPALLYIGSEGCPYCGMQRWGLIVVLARFGKFSNLHLMQSLWTERPEAGDIHVLGLSLQQPLRLVRTGRSVQQHPHQQRGWGPLRTLLPPGAMC